MKFRIVLAILAVLFFANVVNAQTVSITSNASGAVCAGTNVVFTATTSGISSPTYQWYKNSVAISGATSSTYSTTTLSNNDQINVRATTGYTSGSISSTNLIANFDAANYNPTSTRWNDLSSSGNHMDFYTSFNYTTLKTAIYSSEGGGSLDVNNNNVYGRTINNTGITGNGAKTMSAWIKFDAADRAWTDIANFGSFASWAQLFEMFGSRNGSGYQIFLIYSGSVVAGATTIPLNTWAYITISADGPSLKIYVNGVLDGSANQALSTVNSPLYLGNSSSTSNYDNLRGKISTLSLWNSALSSQTILDNYNATKGRYTASSGYTSNIITSSINAAPSTPIITIIGDACVNKTTLSTTSGLNSYAWYKDNLVISGATNNTYTPSASGVYQVQVSNGTCSNTSTTTTIYDCAVGVDGKMVPTSNSSLIISAEGGLNFGTGRDFTGKLYNITGISTTIGTIGASTAILGGVISPTNAITSRVGIIYSSDINFGTYTSTTIKTNALAGTYTATISGLSSLTNYYAKSFIVNKAGTSYGSIISFTTTSPPKSVGDIYGGGKIFYILQSGDIGYDINVQHGLIGALSNQSAGALWSLTNSITGATAENIGSGLNNTNLIISNQGNSGTYAAKIARDYTGGGYTDWYLPSAQELHKMLTSNQFGFDNISYFMSSTEYNSTNFIYEGTQPDYYKTPGNGAYPSGTTKTNNPLKVRAIRSF